MTSRGRAVALVGLLVGLAVLIVLDWYRHELGVRLWIPVVATLLALSSAGVIYRALRPVTFRRRSRLAARAGSASVPAGTKRPEEYAGVSVLHQAHHHLHTHAVAAQGDYFLKGLLAAFLPPLALLLLSMQVLGASGDHELASGLILAEILCLAFFLYLVWTNPRPADEWLDARIRTELLRREQYLALAGIGPYGDVSADQIPGQATRRAGLLTGTSGDALRELIPFGPVPDAEWQAAGFDCNERTPRPDLADRIRTYLHCRVGKQLHWFVTEAHHCARNERVWSIVLKVAAGLACIVAVLHARELLSGGSEEAPYARLVTAAGFVLPPLGAAILSLRAVYSFQWRHQIYARTARVLRRYRGMFEALERHDAACASGPELERRFRHAALGVEMLLAQEMEQWLLTMRREELETAP